jgi:hypothetical protein
MTFQESTWRKWRLGSQVTHRVSCLGYQASIHQLRPHHFTPAVPGHPLGIPQIQRRRSIQPVRSDELALLSGDPQEMELDQHGPGHVGETMPW